MTIKIHLRQPQIPKPTSSVKDCLLGFSTYWWMVWDIFWPAIIPSITSIGEGKHLITSIRSILQPIFQKLSHGNSQQLLLFWKTLVQLAITWHDLLPAFLQTQSHASVVFCKRTACWAAGWPNTLSSFQLTSEFKIKFLTGPHTQEKTQPFTSHWSFPPFQKHKRQSFTYPHFTWIKISLHDGRDISKEHTLQITVTNLTANIALKVKLF